MHKNMKFEAIVANPPFSAKWSADKSFLDDERFSAYGKLAPKSKADYAFVQHMIYHLDENGTMGIVLPHGVLFRGAAESKIRRYLIEEKNYLDAVIGLPANIFYGTSIPTCILIFKKCRTEDEDILFIDASQDFEKAKNQNKLRKEDIDILKLMFKKFKNVPISLEVIASYIGENVNNIRDVYESYLVNEGYIERTKRGRILTLKGIKKCEEVLLNDDF